MTKEIKKQFYTLTKAQQAIWTRAVRAGFSPFLTTDNKLLKRHCPTCRRVGLVYGKSTSEMKESYLACSNGHFTQFD